MTEQTPHNLLHVSATRVSSPEDAAQVSPLPEATQANQSPPLRDYESLALISQEMNKEHRYLADKRAQSQSSNSFYQMAGGALGGAGAGAFLLSHRNKLNDMVGKKADEIADVIAEHVAPYKLISQIKTSPVRGVTPNEEIERFTEIALKNFCPEEHIDACRESAKKAITQTTQKISSTRIEQTLAASEQSNPLLQKFKNCFMEALKIDELNNETKGADDITELSKLLDDVQKELEPKLKKIDVSGESLEQSKKYLRTTIKKGELPNLSLIRETLTKELAQNMHKPGWQIGLSAGAIIASATLGSLAYNFIHSKDKQNIQKTEKKLDALGDAFELYNAPNTTVESSSDISLEKLVDSAEQSPPSRSTL